MRKDGVLTYLYGDHLGSTVLATDGNGTVANRQGYTAGACPERVEGEKSATAMTC